MEYAKQAWRSIKDKVLYFGSWIIHRSAIPAQRITFDDIGLEKDCEKFIGTDKQFTNKKFTVEIRGETFVADGIVSNGNKNDKRAVKIFFWEYNKCYEQHLAEMSQWHSKGYHVVSVNYLGVRNSQGASVLFDDVLALADEVVRDTKDGLSANIPIFVRGRSFGGGPASYMARKHSLVPIIDRSFAKFWLAARDLMVTPKLVAPITFAFGLIAGLIFASTLKWAFLTALFSTKAMVLINIIAPALSKLIFTPLVFAVLELFSTWDIHVAKNFMQTCGPKLFFTAVANDIKGRLDSKGRPISDHSGSNDRSISYASSLEAALRAAGKFKEVILAKLGWQADQDKWTDEERLQALSEDCRAGRNPQCSGDTHEVSTHNLVTHAFGRTVFQAEEEWCEGVIKQKLKAG